MLSLEIRTKNVKLNIDKSTAESFCRNVLNILHNEPNCYNVMSYLGAVWLYNKLRMKQSKTISIKTIPLEYGIMIIKHCKTARTYHDLEATALYTIYEQLDKQITFNYA